MSVKLNFKLEREKFSHITGTNVNIGIRNELEKCFTEKRLQFSKAYNPSHKYIKVLLSSEKVVDKIFSHNDYFISKAFQPNLPIQVRSSRTVFCYGFDTDLLRVCDAETIKQNLTDSDPSWEVSNVYVLQSKRSMKIEFKFRATASKFLELKSINICGTRIENHHMELEVDPSINQCYNCGIIDPGHTREQCPHPPCCLRCGYEGHLFFQCQLKPSIFPSH